MHVSARFPVRRTAALLALIALAWAAPALSAQELKPIQLPKPQITGGKPLMQALAERKTTRAFRDQALPLQTLSNLLWAAFGVNRPTTEMPGGIGRTAPSAMNYQEIELDVVLAQGVYVYDAVQNLLSPRVVGDLRAKVGTGAADHAALTIVYVADAKNTSAQVDTGFIAQNVYLFAASEGLNAWFYAFHGEQNGAALAEALKLAPGRRQLYGQSVGYPVK